MAAQTKRVSLRDVGEGVAVLGVILSLVFVGLEIRQNTVAARAAAYQEIGLHSSDWWFSMASDPELQELLVTSRTQEGWEALTDMDRRRIEAVWTGVLREWETVFLQVESGLLDAEAMDYLGFGADLSERYSFEQLWGQLRMGLGPGFRARLESEWHLPSR